MHFRHLRGIVRWCLPTGAIASGSMKQHSVDNSTTQTDYLSIEESIQEVERLTGTELHNSLTRPPRESYSDSAGPLGRASQTFLPQRRLVANDASGKRFII